MKIAKLSEPVVIPDQFREIVLNFLRRYFENEVWRLRNHFGIELDLNQVPASDDDFLRIMIAESISQMSLVAAGDTKHLDRGEVFDHVDGLLEHLFSVPGEESYNVPHEFWQSDFGAIVMAAHVWSQGDRLITISEAAEVSGKSVKSISQFVARGKLKSYPDMSEPNPRRRMRVLKSEIKALR